MRLTLLIMGLCLFTGRVVSAQSERPITAGRPAIGQQVDLDRTFAQIRTDGKTETLNLQESQAGKNLVLFFFSEQCGVTFYYKSRIQQIQREFENKGFVFVGVLCGKREKPEQPLKLAETKYLKMPFVDDAQGDLAYAFRIRQSVTFAVIDKSGKLRYRGGLDDNVEEKKVKKTYLRNALRELASGKPITIKEGKTLGCAILPIRPDTDVTAW